MNRDQRIAQFASFYSKRLQVQARLAPERLADFRVSIDGQYQCPKCWIYDGRQTVLTQIASESPGHETFECERCGSFGLPVSRDPDEEVPAAP
jgi:hypothetical protein